MRTILAVVFLVGIFVHSLPAQLSADAEQKVPGITYPPVAELARVVGDVKLAYGPEGIKYISGPLMLATPTVIAAAKELIAPGNSEGEIIFHFSLLDPDIRRITRFVQKGDALDRLFLRVFHIPTVRVEEEYSCNEKKDQTSRNRLDATKRPIEIWIHGVTRCLRTETSTLASL